MPDNNARVLTVENMYGLARLVKFTPDKAMVAAAVGMAESSGRPEVISANPDGGQNVGLWQLDTPGGAGAGFTVSQLQVPATNAQVTYKATAHGTNWSQWQTYNQGTYKQFMAAAAKAREKETLGTSPLDLFGFKFTNTGLNPLAGVGNPLKGIDELAAVAKAAFNALTDGKLWRSLGWVILGLLLLFAGVALFFKKQLGQAAEVAAL